MSVEIFTQHAKHLNELSHARTLANQKYSVVQSEQEFYLVQVNFLISSLPPAEQ